MNIKNKQNQTDLFSRSRKKDLFYSYSVGQPEDDDNAPPFLSILVTAILQSTPTQCLQRTHKPLEMCKIQFYSHRITQEFRHRTLPENNSDAESAQQ